jgi:hypothetical protein
LEGGVNDNRVILASIVGNSNEEKSTIITIIITITTLTERELEAVRNEVKGVPYDPSIK